MMTFDLHLLSSTQKEVILGLISFVGEDDSGQFGIMANHTRMMTSLVYGLAKFKLKNNEVEYLAFPGAILYFTDNKLYITTRQYLHSQDYQTILSMMDEQLQKEGANIQSIKESLHRLDREMLKKLWEINQQGRYEI